MAGSGRFVGDSARLGVPASGTVRGRPPSERPECDGVTCGSSLLSSAVLSLPSVRSASTMKAPRVGLRTRVGRRRGLGELAAFPEAFPVGNKVPLRVEVCGGGVSLGDREGGLAVLRCAGDAVGDVSVAREGDTDVTTAQ